MSRDPFRRPQQPFRVYTDGPAAGPLRWALLDGWREACRREELAIQQGSPGDRVMAAIARVACEEAMLDARRN